MGRRDSPQPDTYMLQEIKLSAFKLHVESMAVKMCCKNLGFL